MEQRTYVYQGEYGDRKTEAAVIKDMLTKFDKDTLTGCGIFVNNNIYNLQLFIFFTLEKRFLEFELTMQRDHSDFSTQYNMFIDNLISGLSRKAGNVATFIDSDMVDSIMKEETNQVFLWPAKKIANEIWGYFVTPPDKNAFISHKSCDKLIARQIKNFLNSSEISVWFDEEEILPGMSIVNSISKGLDTCRGCIVLISRDFLASASKWTFMELNYFLSMIGGGSDHYIIPVLLDVDHNQLPVLLRNIRALTYGEENWEANLLASVKRVGSK